MTKEQLWRIYTERNPHFLTEGARFTPAGLRKFFDQTFDAGHELGLDNGKVLAGRGQGSNSPTIELLKKFAGL